jgi:hypothetical protein
LGVIKRGYIFNFDINLMRRLVILIVIIISIICAGICAAAESGDILVWQGQYFIGNKFQTGTYEFNFSVYDDLTLGDICYSNTTNITTGNWGEWKTEQSGVSSACNNVSKNYYLNINIDGVDQTPRKRLTIFNFLRKDVDELTTGKLQTASQVVAPVIQANTQVIAPVVNTTQVVAANVTTIGTGFFSYLGSLASRITKLFIRDIDASGNIETSENVSAKYFKGDGSLLTNLPAGGGGGEEIDPIWAANSSTVARTGNCPAGQFVQNTTTGGVQCMTLSSGTESDPQWTANFTNMQTDCLSNNYAYGINGNGTLKCRQDQSGSGLAPVYLESALNATNAAYTAIFTIALTPSKMNVIQAYLAQSSSTNGVAIQNRAIISESGPIGNCHFVTQTGAAAEGTDNIAVSTNSADTGVTAMSLDTNVPFINTVTCTVLADANSRDLIIQFDSETAATVTTYAGSYYTNAVN